MWSFLNRSLRRWHWKGLHYLNVDVCFGRSDKKWRHYSRSKWPKCRTINKRELQAQLSSLHCYGNSKRLGMNTANDGKEPSRRLVKERTSQLLHRPRTVGFSVCSKCYFLHSGPCSLGVWESFALYFCGRTCNERSFPMMCLSWWYRLWLWRSVFWVQRPTLSILEAVESVDKGLRGARRDGDSNGVLRTTP